MFAPGCQHTNAKRFGRDRKCNDCGKTFLAPQGKPIGDMRIDIEHAASALRLLLEGMSIRGTERITRVDHRTIIKLVVEVGKRCKQLIAWHLGKRSEKDTHDFAYQLDRAVSGRSQLSTDGYKRYRTAIPRWLSGRCDFGQIVKTYSTPSEQEQRSDARFVFLLVQFLSTSHESHKGYACDGSRF